MKPETVGPLPFQDYDQIFAAIYSVFTGAGGRRPHRACEFFSTFGALLLQEEYGLEATVAAGVAAYKLSANPPLCFGRLADGRVVADVDAYHVWVELDGYAIDFSAPLFADIAVEEGCLPVPRRMFQRRIAEAKNLGELQSLGDFALEADEDLNLTLTERFWRDPRHFQLIKAGMKWYKRPPVGIFAANVTLREGESVQFFLDAPRLEGKW